MGGKYWKRASTAACSGKEVLPRGWETCEAREPLDRDTDRGGHIQG